MQNFIDNRLRELHAIYERSCRFHHTDGFHSFGCEHKNWTDKEWREVRDLDRANAERLFKSALTELSQQWKECVPEEKPGDRTDWEYDAKCEGFNDCCYEILEKAKVKGLI